MNLFHSNYLAVTTKNYGKIWQRDRLEKFSPTRPPHHSKPGALSQSIKKISTIVDEEERWHGKEQEKREKNPNEGRRWGKYGREKQKKLGEEKRGDEKARCPSQGISLPRKASQAMTTKLSHN